MRVSESLHWPTSHLPVVFSIPLLLLLHLLDPASGSTGSDYGYGAHPRFICTPISPDADPACFPTGGPGGAGGSGPTAQGFHAAPGEPPAGWWGMTEEAKVTILHLRENIIQQKESMLELRETVRELTAKLTLCESFGRGAAAPDRAHRGALHPRHEGAGSQHTHGNSGHHSPQPGHHGNILESAHYPSAGGHRSDGHGSSHGKDKHTGAGAITSSPEQMERMLQALKERLDNLQKRNSSSAYSSSLKELLQRKISALEEQLHRHTAALSSPEHRHDDSGHHDISGHHDKSHHQNTTPNDHDDHHGDRHDDDDDDDDDDHDDDDDDDADDDDGDDDDAGPHGDHRNDSHGDHDGDDRHGADGGHGDGHHGNEADDHSYAAHTGYRAPGPRLGVHSNKLETMLDQLHLTGVSRKKAKSIDAFQIGFPMRTNYMYGRVKRTLLHEIFAFTLCLWIKAGVGPGLGTPFSYSVPGQANELVLIEWGNNPMELLVDDKAVTLPLSLGDGKWHHMCMTWSTRDGQWEAFQDGVQRGSGENLSAWHPIKPGGVFILGQEQDTLGGRFDATQSFVGEISDVQMWSHVLTASDISSLATCSNHFSGDVISWSETNVELHGGVTKYPFDPCH